MSAGSPLHLAVALEGAGWHPAAWRESGARPAEMMTAGYWTDLVRQAERSFLDFVTFEDSLRLQSSRFDGPDFPMNGDERVAETVQFLHRFAFGGFDHHRPAHGKGDRRGVKAIIHQPFGHVFDAHALKPAQIHDALVGDESVLAFVKHGKIGVQPAGNVRPDRTMRRSAFPTIAAASRATCAVASRL